MGEGGKMKYECPLCNAGFNTIEEYATHMKELHPDLWGTIVSNPKPGCKKVTNIYYDPNTEELVFEV